MSYEYSENLDYVARERYQTKIVAAGLEVCPYQLEAGRWANDPTKWPDVQYPDIYAYLVDTPGVYTKESMKNFRSLEAHNYFISGWVHTIFHCKTTTGLFLLKADVKPSQRLNDDPHHPWVTIKKDGVVVAAHCDCMAGLGESCSHIAALLFKIEAAVRMGYTTSTCTDEPCIWNQCFTKKVEPAPIHRIEFYSDASKERLRQRKRLRLDISAKATQQQQQTFLATLAEKRPKCVVLSSFDQFCDPFVPSQPTQVADTHKLPTNLRTLYDPSNVQDLTTTLSTFELPKDTAEQRKYLRDCSMQQADSTTWHEMRLGRITASRVHSVLHTNIHAPAPSVIKKICSPSADISHIPAVKWGRDHESDAFTQYEADHRASHEDCVNLSVHVQSTGLWLHKEYTFIGASPDGLVNCNLCGSGVLEIKCPYKYRDYISMDQVLSDRACCLDQNGHLKKEHEYYAQVQTQMVVCGSNYADFVLWMPNLFIVQRVAFDRDFVDKMMSVMIPFWHKHCLPELLTRSLENKVQPAISNTSNEEFNFCLCKDDIGGTMIGCDNQRCEIKWFHLSCLNRKRAPKGQWYCKQCKRK